MTSEDILNLRRLLHLRFLRGKWWAAGSYARTQYHRSGSLPQLGRDQRRERLSLFSRSAILRWFAVVRSAVVGLEWQLWAVIVATSAVTAVMTYWVPFWYGGGDHDDYFNFGKIILGQLPGVMPFQWRTPGMGLFHIASGTLLFDTWHGYLALITLTMIGLPILTYLLIRPYSQGFALLASLVTVLSMTPYIYARNGGSDQVYFFLHMLLLLMCVTYFRRRADFRFGLPVAIGITASYLTLVRPVGAVIFWLFIAIAFLARWWDWRRLLVACGLYASVMAGWALWDRDFGGNNGDSTNFFEILNAQRTTTERRFAEAYFSPQGLSHARNNEAATYYPRTTELRDTLRRSIAEHPEQWQKPTYLTPPSLFARFADRPQVLLDSLFTDANAIYFAFIIRTAQQALGPKQGLALIHDVAAEHGTTGLYGLAAFFARNPTRLLFGATPSGLGARNMFAMFYRAKFRDQMRRVYSIVEIPDPILTAEQGPASARLLGIIHQFINDYPQYLPMYLGDAGILARYKDQPGALFRTIASGGDDAATNNVLEGFVYAVATWYLGATPAGRLYSNVAREEMMHYPKLIALFYDNFLDMTLVRKLGAVEAPLFLDLYKNSDVYFDTRLQIKSELTPGLAAELAPTIDNSKNMIWKAAATLHYCVYLIAPLFILMLVASLPFFRGSAATLICGFLLVIYLYEVASIAVFTPYGGMRYEASFYLLPLFIACIILGQAYHRRGKQRTSSSSAS